MPHLTKEKRRRQLLDAAIATFGRRGYHRTQVSDIIRKARVARGTFYLHFEGKRQIFDAVMTDLFARVQENVKTLPRDAIQEIPKQLKGNIERVTDLLLGNPLLTKILFNESVGLDPQLDRRLTDFYGRLLDLIRRGLKQGQEMGFVREGDIQTLAVSLLGSLKEIFYQLQLGTLTPDRPAIVGEIYRLVTRAIVRPDLLSQID